MKAMQILLGWILLFIVACWIIGDMGEEIQKYHGIGLALALFCNAVTGALIGCSIWRDRLA